MRCPPVDHQIRLSVPAPRHAITSCPSPVRPKAGAASVRRSVEGRGGDHVLPSKLDHQISAMDRTGPDGSVRPEASTGSSRAVCE
ncbi:hypothetical protein ACFPN7_13405 [Amycolatopsis halotolerans]|uniref:hypothetical protein n=1 Tax=Amycolatopsis halotolerans TaxID=330083 RepID=UPI003617DB11